MPHRQRLREAGRTAAPPGSRNGSDNADTERPDAPLMPPEDTELSKMPPGDPIDPNHHQNGANGGTPRGVEFSAGTPTTPRVVRHGTQPAGSPDIFCQMDVLFHFKDGEMEWREAARYRVFYFKVFKVSQFKVIQVFTNS
jgi:hypothetical protein